MPEAVLYFSRGACVCACVCARVCVWGGPGGCGGARGTRERNAPAVDCQSPMQHGAAHSLLLVRKLQGTHTWPLGPCSMAAHRRVGHALCLRWSAICTVERDKTQMARCSRVVPGPGVNGTCVFCQGTPSQPRCARCCRSFLRAPQRTRTMAAGGNWSTSIR